MCKNGLPPEITKIIADNIGVNESEVNSEARLVEDLGADSLDIEGITMDLSKEYNITFSQKDRDGFVTVIDIASCTALKILNRLAGK